MTRANHHDAAKLVALGAGALLVPGHEHYRVRWDDDHESLHFPAQGTTILHSGRAVTPPRTARRRREA